MSCNREGPPFIRRLRAVLDKLVEFSASSAYPIIKVESETQGIEALVNGHPGLESKLCIDWFDEDIIKIHQANFRNALLSDNRFNTTHFETFIRNLNKHGFKKVIPESVKPSLHVLPLKKSMIKNGIVSQGKTGRHNNSVNQYVPPATWIYFQNPLFVRNDPAFILQRQIADPTVLIKTAKKKKCEELGSSASSRKTMTGPRHTGTDCNESLYFEDVESEYEKNDSDYVPPQILRAEKNSSEFFSQLKTSTADNCQTTLVPVPSQESHIVKQTELEPLYDAPQASSASSFHASSNQSNHFAFISGVSIIHSQRPKDTTSTHTMSSPEKRGVSRSQSNFESKRSRKTSPGFSPFFPPFFFFLLFFFSLFLGCCCLFPTDRQCFKNHFIIMATSAKSLLITLQLI